ncbi:MAG: hypothetical protein ABIJ84_00545 [bacterium]
MRILLPKGEQRKFIEKILAEISVVEVAKFCGLSERTIRDWRREKFLMQKDAMLKLCSRTNIPKPKNFEIKDDFWYASKGNKLGGKLGALACIKKYGCIGGPKRKEKWYEWWYSKGQYNPKIISFVKPFKKPKYSETLAEFVGIVLGDGSVGKKQIEITLHYLDDKEYGEFVSSMVKNLFDVHVGRCLDKKYSVNRFIISRSRLIDFCVKKLGLKIGNKIKQQVDIPDWVKNKESYSIACVRGLFDTDGSVFYHRYKVNGKTYVYRKLAFTSYSEPLKKSYFTIMKKVGLNPRLVGKDVRFDGIEEIKKYFNIIGSHNPKHLKRYYK